MSWQTFVHNEPFVTDGHCLGCFHAKRLSFGALSFPLGMSAGLATLGRLQAAAQRRGVGWTASKPNRSRRVVVERSDCSLREETILFPTFLAYAVLPESALLRSEVSR